MNRFEEPILTEDNTRFTQLPLKYPELQKAYLDHESKFWTAAEIDYTSDKEDWSKLDENEKHFIMMILAFFAGADGVVLENLVCNFVKEVKIPEARNFYTFQAMIENVHAMTYANLLDTFVECEETKNRLFNAIDTIPCVSQKANWAIKYMNNDLPFEERLVAFAVVEGLFFSASFCAIFWLKSRGIMTKALGGSNELIARDEGLHTDFAIMLHSYLNNKCSKDKVYKIVKDAIDIEKEFICESIRCDLIGMNMNLMKQYIEFVADRLVVKLGYEPLYSVENPFDFMNRINIDSKTNFFEKRNTDYQHAKISSNDWNKITVDKSDSDDDW